MKHYEIKTFESPGRQVIYSRTEVVPLALLLTVKPVFFTAVPVFLDTPQGRIQLSAEVIIDAATSDEAFDKAQAEVTAKYSAARQKAIEEFAAQQRAASLRGGA